MIFQVERLVSHYSIALMKMVTLIHHCIKQLDSIILHWIKSVFFLIFASCYIFVFLRFCLGFGFGFGLELMLVCELVLVLVLVLLVVVEILIKGACLTSHHPDVNQVTIDL